MVVRVENCPQRNATQSQHIVRLYANSTIDTPIQPLQRMTPMRDKKKGDEEELSEESGSNVEYESDEFGERRKKQATEVTVPTPEAKKKVINPVSENRESPVSKKPPSKMQPLQSSAKVPASGASSLKKQPVKSKASKTVAKSVRKRDKDESTRTGSVAKKAKMENFSELLQSSDEEDGNKCNDDEDSIEEELTVDELIAKAEEQVNLAIEYNYSAPFGTKELQPFKMVSKYQRRVAEVKQGKTEKARSKSPIWSHVKEDGSLSLQMLHGLQTVIIYIVDVLYVNSKLKDTEVDPILQMIATYMCKFGMFADV